MGMEMSKLQPQIWYLLQLCDFLPSALYRTTMLNNNKSYPLSYNFKKSGKASKCQQKLSCFNLIIDDKRQQRRNELGDDFRRKLGLWKLLAVDHWPGRKAQRQHPEQKVKSVVVPGKLLVGHLFDGKKNYNWGAKLIKTDIQPNMWIAQTFCLLVLKKIFFLNQALDNCSRR